jgi:hypothetical protein
MFQLRVDVNPRSQVSRPSCPLLLVGLTVSLDNMYIATTFCLSSVQVARKPSSPVGCLHVIYTQYLIVTAALMRPMSPSKGSRVFYKNFGLQKSRQALLRRRRTCGRLYIPPSFLTILRTTYPIHVSTDPTTLQPYPEVFQCRVRMYLYLIS